MSKKKYDEEEERNYRSELRRRIIRRIEGKSNSSDITLYSMEEIKLAHGFAVRYFKKHGIEYEVYRNNHSYWERFFELLLNGQWLEKLWRRHYYYVYDGSPMKMTMYLCTWSTDEWVF